MLKIAFIAHDRKKKRWLTLLQLMNRCLQITNCIRQAPLDFALWKGLP